VRTYNVTTFCVAILSTTSLSFSSNVVSRRLLNYIFCFLKGVMNINIRLKSVAVKTTAATMVLMPLEFHINVPLHVTVQIQKLASLV